MDSIITVEIYISSIDELEDVFKRWNEIKNECQIPADTRLKITVA